MIRALVSTGGKREWLAVLLVFALLASTVRSSQRATPEAGTPEFEEASIRPVADNPGKSYYQFSPSGSVALTNVSVRQIIFRAYKIDFMMQRFALATRSRDLEKILDVRFEIRAKAPEGSSREQQLAMLRALLAQRFSLVTHTELRATLIYALKLARTGRLGENIRRTAVDCAEFRTARREARVVEEPRDVHGIGACTKPEEYNTPKKGAFTLRDAGPFSVLVERLKGFVDRPLVDETGLAGNFDWVVAFSNDPLEDEFPSIAQALEDRLGLKLEQRTTPMEVLVIDSAALPSAN
jgi:uncharacterized protein (TIGR03435 family)